VNRLEQRYRLVLRTLLPASYRRVWEEDMVATFLESMATDDAEAAEYLADFGRPSWSEVASVAALAVRLRLAADAPLRSGVWGEAVRLVALMGLLVHAAAATIEAGSMLWLAGRVDWLAAPPGDWAPALPHSAWPTISTTAGLLWLPAYVGLLLGHRRAAQLLAFLALLPATAAAIAVTMDLAGTAPLVLPAWANLLLSGLLVLALAAFHHDAPPVRRRPWLVALGVAIAVLLGLSLSLLVRPTTPWVLLDWPGLYCLALVGAALAHLAGPALGRKGRAPSWTLALALLAPAVFGLRVLSLLQYLGITPSGQRYALLVVGAAEALAVLAVGVPLARLAADMLRRLAPVSAASAASPPPTR
jgi:hypothetical protein